MADGLIASNKVELSVIALAPVGDFCRQDYRNVKQWLVPAKTTIRSSGLPSERIIQQIVLAVTDFAPDLIHVWGTEYFWGLLIARGYIKRRSLLEIQGLKEECSKAYYGGLNFRERMSCIWIKEMLLRRTLSQERAACTRSGIFEREIIEAHNFIDVQSEWVSAHVKAINPNACQFAVELPMRQDFYNAKPWCWRDSKSIFCTAGYGVPFKGLHVIIRVLNLLRERYPDVKLRIAGGIQQFGIRQSGYVRWLNRCISMLRLNDSIKWLGPLNAKQIVQEFQNAAVAVFPSYVETYCVALAEAMYVGVPSVVAYNGGVAHLGKNDETCLFFPAGDEPMCAYHIENILLNRSVAERLSSSSRSVAANRNSLRNIVNKQISIYIKTSGFSEDKNIII